MKAIDEQIQALQQQLNVAIEAEGQKKVEEQKKAEEQKKVERTKKAEEQKRK